MKKTIILLLLTLALNSCNKDDDKPKDPIEELPVATQTGKNTFGCLINGVPFIVRNTSMQTAIYQGGGLLIGAQKNINSNFSQVSISLSESIIGNVLTENNSYLLNSDTMPKGEYYVENQNCFYFTSNNYIGNLSITKFDKINFVISGTFEFQSKSNSCEGIINITNGRFDLQYIP